MVVFRVGQFVGQRLDHRAGWFVHRLAPLVMTSQPPDFLKQGAIMAYISVPTCVAYISTPGTGDEESPAPTADELREFIDTAPVSPGHFCTLSAPTADGLRYLAERLRTLAKDIFQGGQDNHFVSAEAGKLRHPLITDWYNRACCFQDKEQQRFFFKAWLLLGDVASVPADSLRERLQSLATDVDELAATIDPQSAGGGQADADTSKCPRPAMPTDPTTRDLIIALQEGMARGEKIEQIHRDFLSKRTVPCNAVASLKKAARRYRAALKKWEGADT